MKTKNINEIIIPHGRREVGDLTDLKRSIAEVGLLHAITLDPSGNLLAGLRRLEACRALGWTEIPANEVTLDALRSELVTLEENLTIAQLTILERAQQLARQKDIYEMLHPETRAVQAKGGPGRGKKTGDKVTPVFSEKAGKSLGVSARTIERKVEVARKLDPEAAETIKAHPIANSQTDLNQLANLRPDDQRAVADLLASGGAKCVKAAVRQHLFTQAAGDADTPMEGDHYRLSHGDFLATLASIEAGTVDLVLTDPEWGKDLNRYPELAEGIARVLKPGGQAIIMIGPGHLPDLLDGVRAHLQYRWTLSLLRLHRQCRDFPSGMMGGWLPAVVATTIGTGQSTSLESDVVGQERRGVTHGTWEKGEDVVAEIIQRFSKPGDLVVDPFCGLGSTGSAALRLARRFVGGDIDAERVRATAARLAAVKWADPKVRPVDRSRGVVTERWEETR